jgi:hypothetical protein
MEQGQLSASQTDLLPGWAAARKCQKQWSDQLRLPVITHKREGTIRVAVHTQRRQKGSEGEGGVELGV